MRKCSGDIIFLCDQDDIWDPKKIEEMSKIMESRKDIGLLASNYSFFSQEYSETKKAPFEVRKNTGKLFQANKRKYYGHVLRPGCTYCVKSNLVSIMNKCDIHEYGHDCALWHIALAKKNLWIYEKKLLKQRLHCNHASKALIPIGVQRRIIELNRSIFMCEYVKRIDVNNDYANEMINYYKTRKTFLEKKSSFCSLFYNLINFRKSGSFRNMIGDFVVLSVRKG